MTIITSIDKLVEWLNTKVCTQIKLKQPDDENSAEGYNKNHKMINPSAFPLYVPNVGLLHCYYRLKNGPLYRLKN